MSTTCPDPREIEGYLNGALSDVRAAQLESHLTICVKCDLLYEQLEKQNAELIRKFSAIPTDRLPRHTPEHLPDLLPRDFGTYRLLEKIGEGGMGAVYAAEHRELRSLVAIKILRPRFVADDSSRDRFRREIAAVGKVRHSAIVRALDAGEVDGVCFLAMDYIDGINLSTLLKQVKRIPWAAACEIAVRAGVGLREIHTAEIVHRDIKPGNLILSRSGEVQILDLGLALQFGEESSLTETGQLMGTVDYIAPEQADDTHHVDCRADIYSLGATLFALITGEPPYGRSNAHLIQKLSKLANEPPIALGTIVEDVPSALANAVEKALARRPDDRFQNAGDFLAAIQPFASSPALAEFVQTSVEFPSRPYSMDAPLDDTILLSTAESRSASMPAARILPSVLRGKAQLSQIEQSRRHLFLRRPYIAASVLALLLISFLMLYTSQSLDRGTVISDSKDSPRPIHADLLRLVEAPSEQKDLWEIFSRNHRPDDRSAVLHQAKDVLPLETLIQRYCDEPTASIKAGLLLAISDYPSSLNVLNTNKEFLGRLRSDFLVSSDTELHSAIELLLTAHGMEHVVNDLNSVARQRTTKSGWYQPLLAPTMNIIELPEKTQLGSSVDEPGRMTNTDLPEDLRIATFDYRFAISSKEISRRLYSQLMTNYWENPEGELAELPQNAMTWDDAARFCNLLSAAEGFSPEEFCYEETLVGTRRVMLPVSNALQRRGFRLPTEDEWEAACRAGTVESRHFGNQIIWLTKFALGGQPETKLQPVGRLKPNPFGLFDMLGNVSEWTHDRIELGDGKTGHIIRGGSVSSPIDMLRSAGRYRYLDGIRSQKVGFRVAQSTPDPSPVTRSPDELTSLRLCVGPPWTPESAARPPADSDFQPVDSDEPISFGLWHTSQHPLRWFQLQNHSSRTIQLEDPPALMDGFEYVVSPTTEISPGQSILFCVGSSPKTRIGTHHCHTFLTIAGMPERQPRRLQLISRFHGALLEVMHHGSFADKRADISIGRLPQGSQLGSRQYLRNVGDQPATVKVSDLLGNLKLADELTGPVFPHRLDRSIRVIVNAESSGIVQGSFKLKSPEAAAREFEVRVFAEVVPNLSCSAIGIFRDGIWLVDWNHDGHPDERISFGEKGDQPFTGDFDGDGIWDLGVWRRCDPETTQVSLFHRGQESFDKDFISETQIKAPQLQRVLAMDRNRDGRSELCYVESYNFGQSLMWMVDLTNKLRFEQHFQLGKSGDVPFVADWNGDQVDDFGISTPGTGTAAGRLKIEYFWTGLSTQKEAFALSPFDFPLAGDWDGDGDDDIGGWRPPNGGQSAIWQFDIDGDFESDRDLEGFGVEGDIPFVLRADRTHQKP